VHALVFTFQTPLARYLTDYTELKAGRNNENKIHE